MTKDAQKVLDMVEKMTILELADLVKVMEEKFGVSAAAPTAVVTAPVATEEVEEKSTFNILLKDGGSNKIGVIKVVREITELGLKEAKDIVDGAPQTIKEEVQKKDAEAIKVKLEEVGATVELE
ncbi:TPA: 50S ribosomal protein L7/L12 [Patescibacteria group bacterium]|nr:50S ribosomal protein L7/L12 [Patescibacteria group bacterium]